jgi:multidrug efflux pump subunit AcrA (membrane-fusion protein)
MLGQDGGIVRSGQELLVAEAMKLEMPLPSSPGGKVKEVPAKEGQTVDAGTRLISLIPSPRETLVRRIKTCSHSMRGGLYGRAQP